MTQTGLLGDLPVRRVGFGAMQLAGPGVFGPPADRDAALAVLRRTVELGVDHVDTAQFYGPDVVNELVREALHPYPEGLRLVTKVGARRDEQGAWLPAGSPEELQEQVRANLRALGTEQLAVVNLRRYELDHPENDTHALEEQLDALAELRDEGLVAHLGVSNVRPETARTAAERVGVVCVQNPFSILDQSDRPTLELCAELGLAYVPFFPLGSAFNGGPAALAADAELAAVAARREVTPSRVALAWLLAQHERVLLIPGTRSPAHLEDNLAAADLALDADDLEQLSRVQPARVGL
jgi:aryl-alcohol dehydrogenase-like predicted oxidoreductase